MEGLAAKRFVSVGECMVELSGADGADLWKSGFAGDTFNTAWYARQRLGAEWQVAYHTVLGTDPLSERMIGFIGASGVETASIGRHPTRMPGLYMISLANGERSFSYWRDSSAARTLADDPAALDAAFAGAGVIYFSGITAAILGEEGRARFLAALGRARAAGVRTVFDPNIRLRLWPDLETLRRGLTEAAAAADIVLPGHEDEAACFGDATPEATAERYLAGGSSEVVVKNGGQRMVIGTAGAGLLSLPEMPTVTPVDTTGAGDSFNAGYLAARLGGATVESAVAEGHALAMRVVSHRGALVPGATAA